MSLAIKFEDWISNQGSDEIFDCPECDGDGIVICWECNNESDCDYCDMEFLVSADRADPKKMKRLYISEVAGDLKKYSLYTGKDFFDLMADLFRTL